MNCVILTDGLLAGLHHLMGNFSVKNTLLVQLDHCICVCKLVSTFSAKILQFIDALIACMQNMQANKITITIIRLSLALIFPVIKDDPLSIKY